MELQSQNINWFPGHMAKAERMIKENLSLCDAAAEIIDARIPKSSRNPDIDELVGDKPRLVIMNRADLADNDITALWKKHFESKGIKVIETDAKSGSGVSSFVPALREILSDKLKRNEEKGINTTLRVMILGIPNVGKSTFINRVAKKKAAGTGDRPGLTRGKQWINIDRSLDLLDTPGILWPKFEDEETGLMLAVTNAIKSEILDTTAVGADFILKLSSLYPEKLKERYKIEAEDAGSGYELLEKAAAKRGFLVSKGEYDIDRMALTLLKEFQDGKLGRLSLERP